jgi:putative ABC transport system permease protein
MSTSACPFRSNPRNIANRKFRLISAVLARLKPGVSVAQANSSLAVTANQIATAHPDVYAKEGYSASAIPLREGLVRRARTTFLVLLGAAGLVLLIACANVANLLLARLLKLERELAVRSALGASRARLSRQLVTESLLLSLSGGLLGLTLAPATLNLLIKFAEHFTVRVSEIRLDWPVLLFTFLISLAAGLMFGLAPALSVGRRFGEALKQGSGRTTSSRGHQRLRSVLLGAQVAVSFVLLIGAGLMIRSFERLQQVNPGLNPDRILSLRFSPSFSHYTGAAQIQTLLEKILQSVRNTAGVQSAALVSNVPFSPSGITVGPGNNDFEVEGKPVSKGELAPIVDTTSISPQYFGTIRQPVTKGRDFTGHDDEKAMLVAIINQTMARHRWPSEDAIGKRVSFDHGDHWIRIVGIVGDVKEYGLDRPIGDEMYLPMAQGGYAGNLVVRTAADPGSLAPVIRAALHTVDPYLAVDQVQTLEHLERDSMASPRVVAILLGLFAGLALLISASGLASAMALSVRQRTRELGIRMALGAQRSSIVNSVMRQGLAIAASGIAAGILVSVVLAHLVSSLLFATSPTDGLTFAAVSILFFAVAAGACFVPAREITVIDPLIALRQE